MDDWSEPLTCTQTRDRLVAHTLAPTAPYDQPAVQRHLLDCATCRQHQRLLDTFRPAMDPRLAPPLRAHPDTFDTLYRQVVARRRRRVLWLPWLPARRAVWGTLLAAAELAALVLATRWLARHTETAQVATVPRAQVQDSARVAAPPDTLGGPLPAVPGMLDSLIDRQPADSLLFPSSATVPPPAPR